MLYGSGTKPLTLLNHSRAIVHRFLLPLPLSHLLLLLSLSLNFPTPELWTLKGELQMLEIYQWRDLMEAVEYLWVPPNYNLKLKSTLKCRIKLIKMPLPKCFMLVLKEVGCETSRNI